MDPAFAASTPAFAASTSTPSLVLVLANSLFFISAYVYCYAAAATGFVLDYFALESDFFLKMLRFLACYGLP